MTRLTREQHLMLERLTGQEYCLNGKPRQRQRTLRQAIKLGYGHEYIQQHIDYLEKRKAKYDNTGFGKFLIDMINEQINLAKESINETQR